MTAAAWAGLCVAATLLLAAVGELINEEIRGWLDLAPRAILRLAATQLDPAQRETIYHDEWLPELTYALRGAESRPITRLIRGTAYATGLLIAARRIARRVHRASQGAAVTTSEGGTTWISITNESGHPLTLKSIDVIVANGNTLNVGVQLPKRIRKHLLNELRQQQSPGMSYMVSVPSGPDHLRITGLP